VEARTTLEQAEVLGRVLEESGDRLVYGCREEQLDEEDSCRYRLRDRTPSCQSFACSSLTSTDSGSSSRYSASLSRCVGRRPAPCAASMASTDSHYETVVNSATSPLISRNCCMPRQPGFFSTSRTPFS
jgi:hypothetical protein